MFMLGDGDWHSTRGRDFDRLERHLSYVSQTYVDRGLVFGTPTELVAAVVDYYFSAASMASIEQAMRPEKEGSSAEAVYDTAAAD